MQSHHNLALFIELLSWKGVKTCENVNYQRTSLAKSWANSIEVYSSLQFLKLIQLSLSRGTKWHARRTHTSRPMGNHKTSETSAFGQWKCHASFLHGQVTHVSQNINIQVWSVDSLKIIGTQLDKDMICLFRPHDSSLTLATTFCAAKLMLILRPKERHEMNHQNHKMIQNEPHWKFELIATGCELYRCPDFQSGLLD